MATAIPGVASRQPGVSNAPGLARARAGSGRPGASDPGVQIRSWCGACPEELVEAWTLLKTQMDADVPLGTLTRITPPHDIESVRRNERRMADQGYVLVRSLAAVKGRPVGYTELFVSRHEPLIAPQDDTLVDRDHRGRGIGRALKLANLRQLATVPEACDTRWVQTYVALGNAPMTTLNRAIGFSQADVMVALEGPVSGLRETNRP